MAADRYALVDLIRRCKSVEAEKDQKVARDYQMPVTKNTKHNFVETSFPF